MEKLRDKEVKGLLQGPAARGGQARISFHFYLAPRGCLKALRQSLELSRSLLCLYVSQGDEEIFYIIYYYNTHISFMYTLNNYKKDNMIFKLKMLCSHETLK